MTSIFGSRSFWVAFLTILTIVIASIIPSFSMDVEHAAGLGVIAAGYLIAYALNPSGKGLAGMLTSRKFWTALLGFGFVLLDAFHVFPAPLDIANLAGLVVLVAAYTITLAIDPGAGWRRLLVSRKFWAAVIGIVFLLLDAFKVVLPVEITPGQVVGIVIVIAGYIAKIGIDGSPEPLPDPELPEETEPAA